MAKQQNKKIRNKFVIYSTIGIVVLILVLILVLIFSGNSSEQATGSFKGNLTIKGEAISPLPRSFDRNCIFHSVTLCQNFDSGSKSTIPEIHGVSILGKPFKIENDGRNKIILFLAHWCPHCQTEVDTFGSWIKSRGLPKDIDFYAIATANNPSQQNYPPETWLLNENWEIPTIKDTPSDNIAQLFGVTSFPFWALVDSENRLLTRLTGTFEMDEIDVILSKILESQ